MLTRLMIYMTIAIIKIVIMSVIAEYVNHKIFLFTNDWFIKVQVPEHSLYEIKT